MNFDANLDTQLDACLARIRYDGPLAVDANTLETLQRAHLVAVSFENLSIVWGESIEPNLGKSRCRATNGSCRVSMDPAWSRRSPMKGKRVAC